MISPMMDNLTSIYNLCQPIGEVRFIAPEHFDATIDILVLPHGPGINPNLPCFVHGTYAGIPAKPMCPFLERFRHSVLQHYIDANVFIIGLGDAAGILWNHLGGKCAAAGPEVTLLHNPTLQVVTIGTVDYSLEGFRAENIAGVRNPNVHFRNLLRDFKQQVIDDLAVIENSSEDNNAEEVLM